jgi:hypothetical protein
MWSSSDSANPTGWTYSFEYRHQCLVRSVILKRVADRAFATEWLRKWNAAYPGSTLEADVRDQWKKGNRGEPGDWR